LLRNDGDEKVLSDSSGGGAILSNARDRKSRIESKLRAALGTAEIEIMDESHLHAGHAGATGGGHFHVRIVAAAFSGLSLIERQRLVYRVLAEELSGAIHALALETRAPEEIDPSR